ncbi:SufS family cysteine desulfurase [Parashewanella spongiae]|nr:SufS family cysteine desulfurase [Parashewanella spongiae]MCL1078855.1 SufS family cysteine desulfurase [Parashewanella spongiae]
MCETITSTLASKIQSQFPLLNNHQNPLKLCYLDTAATSQKPHCVIDAMNEYYHTYNSNVHRAAHQLSARATVDYEKVRNDLVTFINARTRQEIIFTHGTTESLNMLAYGLESTFSAGDLILIDSAAHHANIVPWQQLAQRTGAFVKAIPLDQDFNLDLIGYQKLLKLRPKLVAISHVTNALGTVNPVSQIISLAKTANAITVVDGAQAIAHTSVDVSELDCDFYAFSGHKMYGPTGVGILYGKTEKLAQLTPMLTGGEMIKTVSFDNTIFGELPNRLEAGTPPISEVIGLGAAIKFMNQYFTKEHQDEEKQLLNYLQFSLAELDDIEIYASNENNLGVVSFNVKGEHHQDVGILLDQQGIAIRCGHHCAMPLMDLMKINGCCRVSIGLYTTKVDIDCFIDALKQVQQLLKD